MTFRDIHIKGRLYMCLVTPRENARVNAGLEVNVPAHRRIKQSTNHLGAVDTCALLQRRQARHRLSARLRK